MPRPRKQSDTQLPRQVIFRVTDAEDAHLEALALRAGMRVNELARRINRRGRNRLVIETTRRHDPAFIAQMQRLGANLNQLVKRAHMRGYVSPKVEELCDEIRRIVFEATQSEDAG